MTTRDRETAEALAKRAGRRAIDLVSMGAIDDVIADILAILAPAIAERDGERDKALRTIESLACMLGWGNVPPRDSLERSISALKGRAKGAESALAESRAEIERLKALDLPTGL